MKTFLERPLEGDWPYLKVRQNERIISAAIIAISVNADGRREVLGLEIGTSQAETSWAGFLRKLDNVQNLSHFSGTWTSSNLREGDSDEGRERGKTDGPGDQD